METLLHAVMSNVGWATVLALGATVACRVFRERPALAHGLWLLVLLKLVTPSLVHFPTSWGSEPAVIEVAAPGRPVEMPRAAELPGSPAGVPAVRPGTSVTRPVETRAPARNQVGAERRPWGTTAIVLWMAGSAVWGSIVILQVSRFRRLLRAGRPAPEALRDRVDRLATRLGLRRGPAVWLVPARVPPMLWAVTGPPRLLLPEDLWGRLAENQQDTVLAHELAHLKRRDHWVRWLEAVVLGLYWWNPVAWWARRRVEEAEEQCCDAWVVWALPEAAEAYAEALVATAAFLSGPRIPWPLGATGVGRVPPLWRRLSMILRDPASGLTARPSRRAALIIGGLSLLVLPAGAPGLSPESARSVPDAQSSRSASPGAGLQRGFGRGVAMAVADQEVAVSQPLVREVSDFEDYTGHVEEARTVEIRARVGGTLEKVYPQADRVIANGDLLFEIDPRSYQLELEKAEAEVKRWEAQLKRSTLDLERAKKLKAAANVSEGEFDRIEGERDESEALLQSARATRKLAQLKLDSTRITAPIRGKVSRTRLATGSLVVADTTVLATIDASDPIYVGFDVDERTALRLARERREGRSESALEPGLMVLVGLSDEGGFPRRGQVESVDTRFDPGKGTLRCRAILPNPDGILIPGLFARVRLVTGSPAKKTLFVPADAVVTYEGRSKCLFVVGDRDVVERRTVRLGAEQDGLRAVNEGLKEGEWVVINAVEAVKAGLLDAAESGRMVRPVRVAIPPRPSTPP